MSSAISSGVAEVAFFGEGAVSRSWANYIPRFIS